jgi:prepilin-type processing-associated H-X9-DG protein
MYSNDNKGVILPCQVWNTAGTQADPWAFLLITGHYLPDPGIKATSADNSANSNTVLVCPGIRDTIAYDFATGGAAATAVADGFDRRMSMVVATTPFEPNTSNGAGGACILDMGYAINGSTQANGEPPGAANLPMQGIVLTGGLTAGGVTIFKSHHITDFTRSAETLALMDGFDWNLFNLPKDQNGNTVVATYLIRISGARHGQFKPASPANSGICNALFLDGHAESVNRADLPSSLATDAVDSNGFTVGANQMTGPPTVGGKQEELNNRYIWNTLQQ